MAYSREIADWICAEVAGGRTLKEICRTQRESDDTFPAASTVRLWVINDPDGFADRYARAREAQSEAWSDDLIETAEDGSNDWMERRLRDGSTEQVLDREHVARSELRVKTKQWLMARNHAVRFGDRIKQEHSGTLTLEQLIERAAEKRKEGQ